jgi:DNA replication protein DnaC
MKSTILISNLAIPQLTETLGERVIDRFRDEGMVLVFDWESYRKRKKG